LLVGVFREFTMSFWAHVNTFKTTSGWVEFARFTTNLGYIIYCHEKLTAYRHNANADGDRRLVFLYLPNTTFQWVIEWDSLAGRTYGPGYTNVKLIAR